MNTSVQTIPMIKYSVCGTKGSMDFVCAFDSPIRLTTAGKVKNFPVHMNQELNLPNGNKMHIPLW